MNYDEINLKMNEAYQGTIRKNRIDSMLKHLEEEKNILETNVEELKTKLDKESKDVIKLKKMSLAHIFYSILGKAEEHMDKEKQEVLAAKLKYEQRLKDLEDIENNISKLLNERTQYLGCKNAYDRLYEEKKNMLLKESGQISQTVMELTDRISASEGRIKEIKEAINAGDASLNSLNLILESLDSAKNWGTYDLLGGGMLSDMVKHSKIDDAKAEAEDAQRLLRNFKTELIDVNIDPNLEINIDGFAKFADIFFDGLIADWSMQSKIKTSIENVLSVKSRVYEVLSQLNKLENEEKNNSEKLQSQMKKIIETA